MRPNIAKDCSENNEKWIPKQMEQFVLLDSTELVDYSHYMIAGVIVDTHDKLHTMDYALDIFQKEHVDIIVHCGDWKTPDTVAYFAREAGKRRISVG